ncbi:DNA-deoxyinosine glycosylase [Crenobacter sp. SG2303]|uniref:DNA-deoxyinosine glycosylase n=1 Tax=Crenobacter oryzisoli TaxID=3056844 RepID=A0ABT7XNN6_9NEIS|nr:DNA-deoxyinosine glycosylase [Crenobacter sp. SG2303]MDN0075386.1 DNA-deoxyinosine glycosylase [Crenobacter sp. SG2303]
MTAKCCFPPVVNDSTRLLILGSLPGDASLVAARYYAHPRNQFWRLLEAVLGVALVDCDYDERLQRLLENGVGLWDVVGQAARRGSLDTALRDITYNNLTELVGRLPALQAVAFNGQTAARGRRQLLDWDGDLVILPSSSPAHTMAFETKLAEWRALVHYLPDAPALLDCNIHLGEHD